MSLLTMLTRVPPEICGYTFDAVLEDELEFSVDLPTYPIESGAEITDHRIINPIRYRIVIAISNTPLQQNFSDLGLSMAGGLVSNLTDNPLVASIAGLSAGFLASSDGTRASAALETLIGILEYSKPFDVQCGDITLEDMVITRITRRKTPENENALEAVLELQELVTLDRLSSDGQPKHTQLSKETVEQYSCSATVNKGLTTIKDVGNNVKDKVLGVFQ